MTAKYAVTDEQRLTLQRRLHVLESRFLKGALNPVTTLHRIQAMIENGNQSSTTPPPADGLSEYYGIRDLYVIGPAEWEKAVRGEKWRNRNPLKLVRGWCPCPPMPYSVEQMRALVELCKTTGWNTRLALWLALPEVGGVQTHLMGQSELWGISNDNLDPGRVRSDVLWSNWFVPPQHPWAHEPAVTEPTWLIGYELPEWTTNHSWDDQQRLVRDRGMSLVPVARSALMHNLLAINGVRFNEQTWARTATIHDVPLSVLWCSGDGLVVDRDRYPELGYGHVGASVEGVPCGG